jgi:hypothetical protein
MLLKRDSTPELYSTEVVVLLIGRAALAHAGPHEGFVYRASARPVLDSGGQWSIARK